MAELNEVEKFQDYIPPLTNEPDEPEEQEDDSPIDREEMIARLRKMAELTRTETKIVRAVLHLEDKADICKALKITPNNLAQYLHRIKRKAAYLDLMEEMIEEEDGYEFQNSRQQVAGIGARQSIARGYRH